MTFNTVILILCSRGKTLSPYDSYEKIFNQNIIKGCDLTWLKKDCLFNNLQKSYKIINLCTGDIYNSIRDCSKKLKIDRDKVKRILRDDSGLKFYENGDEDLVDKSIDLDLSHKLFKKILNKTTGKLYSSIKELSTELGISRKTAKYYIEKENSIYEYVSTHEIDKVYINPRNTPVKAYGIIYPSVFFCARKYNTGEGTIKRWCLDENNKDFEYFTGDILEVFSS